MIARQEGKRFNQWANFKIIMNRFFWGRKALRNVLIEIGIKSLFIFKERILIAAHTILGCFWPHAPIPGPFFLFSAKWRRKFLGSQIESSQNLGARGGGRTPHPPPSEASFGVQKKYASPPSPYCLVSFVVFNDLFGCLNTLPHV